MKIKLSGSPGLFEDEVTNFARAFSVRVMYQAGQMIADHLTVEPDGDEFEKLNMRAMEIFKPMSGEIISESLERVIDQVRRAVKRSRHAIGRKPLPDEQDVDLFTCYMIERAEFYGAFLAGEVIAQLNEEGGE